LVRRTLFKVQAKFIKLMVKEVELALVKRQLYEAKELIADLEEDNGKMQKRIIALEAVELTHKATSNGYRKKRRGGYHEDDCDKDQAR
jgi:hypothetical protein